MLRSIYFVLSLVLYWVLCGVLVSAGVSGWPYWEVNLICFAISIVAMLDMAAFKRN